MAMERLLALMADKKASDLFIAAGTAVQIKINGTTVPINQQRLDPPTIESLLREVLTEAFFSAISASSRSIAIGRCLSGAVARRDLSRRAAAR